MGAGRIGEPKIHSLVDCGARVRVIAPVATVEVRELAAERELVWLRKSFEAGDLDGVFLVVAATSSAEVNHGIYRQAQERGILCNVVDDPPHCDFFYPAVVRRGHFQIAVSTNGLSPALAQRVRRQLEAQFPPVYREWLEELGRKRAELFERVGDPELRRKLIHESVTADSFAQFEQDSRSNGATGVPPGSHEARRQTSTYSTNATGKDLL